MKGPNKSEQIVALLKANPGGMTEDEIRAKMGWGVDHQVGPYITKARAILRKEGLAETIPYRRIAGGDLYRIVNEIDDAAYEAGDERERSARTLLLERAAQFEREGNRLTDLGHNKDAVMQFQAGNQLRSAVALLTI
jgi:cation transport regulator ChaC